MPETIYETFDRYLRKLRQTPLADQTELTGRAALEELLNDIARRAAAGAAAVQHEPRRVADSGAPDFKVMRNGTILGYVETKAIGENLDRVLKSDQIKRYQRLSNNIVLTDYLRFVRISGDDIQRPEWLCHAGDLETPRFRLRDDRVAAVAAVLDGFFSARPEPISKAQQLALALAARSRLLRDYLGDELVRQKSEHTEGRLYGLFQIFRDQIFRELTLKDFADAFAQMLAYGLFLARLNSGTAVTLHNAREYVPGAFRLIRELVDFLTELDKQEYRDVRWVVEEVLSIVNALDLPAIHADLSFRQRKAVSRKLRAADEEEHRLFERDPFIYFYEDFLKAYDPAMRKGRGVYYTPPPIVKFIVRAVDDILKESFGLRDGLADHRRVTVLDFACGTGTFLLEVFQRVFENIGGADSGRADPIVREHLLKNLFGFEYLIAPYTIAHLKLSQFLAEQKHPLRPGERLQVFLTNTLEPIEPQRNLLLPAISAEVEAAQAVKESPILIITGNPPYSGISKNNGTWITKQIEQYKHIDGKHFGERKHWLQDDYVKFIRFAQNKMDQVAEGIVAVITNHSWIYNPTFMGMRKSLLRTFQQIRIVDLHGSQKPRERAPGNYRNENVFDNIMKGVAISLFIKKRGLRRGVWFGDVWGRRIEKYRVCAQSSYRQLTASAVSPAAPHYFLAPHGRSPKWQGYWSLDNVFQMQSTGMLTARDALNVAFDEQSLKKRLAVFASLSPEEARREFDLGMDTRDWRIDLAQEDLKAAGKDRKRFRRVAYRPFDERVVFYTGKSKGLIGQPGRLLAEAIDRSEIALGTVRRVEEGDFHHAFAFQLLPDGHAVSSKETTHVFPLYRPATDDDDASDGDVVQNFSPEFLDFVDKTYDNHVRSEEIFGYIYAILYAPAYRRRYGEFLRSEFPRIPFPESRKAFERLARAGWALVQAHLLRDVPRRGLAGYRGKGDHTVERVRHSPQEQAVWINPEQRFQPVPEHVWEFHIGGYRVLDKYLKSRRGRTLSLDEINHVAVVADCLAFTIDQMARIDAAYRAAFPDRG